MAFTYNVVLQALSFVGCFITIFLLDKVGRRPFLVVGTFLQIPFMCLVAGLGTKSAPSQSDINGLVASIMLFNICVKVSLSTNAYLIASEIGGTRMRKKSELGAALLPEPDRDCVQVLMPSHGSRNIRRRRRSVRHHRQSTLCSRRPSFHWSPKDLERGLDLWWDRIMCIHFRHLLCARAGREVSGGSR